MSAPKDKLRQLMRSAKNSLKTYNEVEKRVREATSNDPWPSTSTLMMRIVADTDDHFLYDSMLSMLLKRLQDTSQIMHVKKALILADFLLRNAGARFINDMKSRLHIFGNLCSYRYLVEGSDKGADVRVKAERMLELLQNDDMLKHERESSRRLKERMGAISYKHTHNNASPNLAAAEFDRVDALDFDGQRAMHNNNLAIESADFSVSTLSNSSLSDSPSMSATSPRHRRRQEREQKRANASKQQRTSRKKAVEARRRSSSSLSDVALDDADMSSEPEEYIVPPQPRTQSRKKKKKKKKRVHKEIEKETEKEVPADDWLMNVAQAPPPQQQQQQRHDALIKDETPALLDVMQPKLDDKQQLKPKSKMQQIEYPQAQIEYPTQNHMALEYQHAPQHQQQQQMVPHGHYDQMQYQHYMQQRQQQQQQLQLQHRQQQPMLALPYPSQQTQALVPSSNLPF